MQRMLSEEKASRDASHRLYIDLAFASTLYRLGLVHPAQIALARLVTNPKFQSLPPLRNAAVSCLASLHRNNKSLGFLPGEKQALLQIPAALLQEKERSALWDLRYRLFLEDMALEHSDAALWTRAPSLFEGAGGYEIFIRALLEIHSGNGEIKTEPGQLLQASIKPAESEKLADFIRLSKARFAFRAGQYLQAIEWYSQVSSNGPWITSAQTEMGWAYLQLKRDQEAVAAAHKAMYNAESSAEGLAIASIAFIETCNFAETEQAIQRFRERTLPAFRWLKDWNRRQKGLSPEVAYRNIMALIQKENSVPKLVGMRWLHNPTFLATQEELNGIIDEEKKLADLKKHAQEGKADNALNKVLASLQRSLQNQGTVTVKKITRNFSRANEEWLNQLEGLIVNEQKVDVEVLSAAGNDEKANQGKQPGQKKELTQSEIAEWEWERRPMYISGEQEMWLDETDLFRSDLKNRCSSDE